MTDWHYIGHYGQLGPLTTDQMRELIESNVVERTTMVWCASMTDWQTAGIVQELQPFFAKVPPSPPEFPRSPPPPSFAGQTSPYAGIGSGGIPASWASSPANFNPSVISEKNRIVAGIVNIFLPGVGRLYLGYIGIGCLQLFLAFLGIGFIWSFVDGILILLGNLQYDGLGRKLI